MNIFPQLQCWLTQLLFPELPRELIHIKATDLLPVSVPQAAQTLQTIPIWALPALSPAGTEKTLRFPGNSPSSIRQTRTYQLGMQETKTQAVL